MIDETSTINNANATLPPQRKATISLHVHFVRLKLAIVDNHAF